MHDLIHDLAQHVAGAECSSINSSSQINLTERTRHVSCEFDSFAVKSGEDDGKRKIYTAKKLRTFVGTCVYNHNEELKKICSTFKRLRVLVMRDGEAQMDRVLDCMHKLKHLRYLDLSDSDELTNLSRSITRLPNLQSLILSGCVNLERFPSDIGKLINLRYLDLSYNDEFTNLPSSITRLRNLQTLKLNSCSSLVRLSEDIGQLVNLRHLDLSRNFKLSNLISSIGGLQNLHTLLLDGCDSLNDMGSGLGQLTGLRRLTKFVVCEEQEGENGACARVSELKGLNNLERTLAIERLERVSHAEIEQVILNSSTHLLKDKQSLKFLNLSWDFCMGDAEDAERLLEGLQPHPNLEQLSITSYGGVKMSSWIGQLLSLQSLCIQECKRLTRLSAGFLHLTALRTLKIYYCEELDLSDDYNGMQFQGLSSLSYLEIVGMPKLASLPVGLQHVTTLQSLRIYECDNLMILPDWIGDFTSLRLLSIGACPKVTSLPEAVRRLGALKELEIIPSISIRTYSPEFKYEKVVLRVWTMTDDTRAKALKVAVSVEGVEFAYVNGRDIEVRGEVDPGSVAAMLKSKVGRAYITSIGPAIEENKRRKERGE